MIRRLKKLELVGFKSFADKTTLEFHSGITGIVGPNGCGKSNISDAFRWVLGEQSAKSIRGTKMPDVIFSGTSHRSPLNVAEVTITLCNEDGKIPVAYHEIAITRRLYRSGESDYLLNKQLVRLKDLQELFLDAGLGKNAFAIFEQGKIDQVIHYSPLERRYIFEEAAGIGKFLQRKREALRKLEQVDQNLSRAKDIHHEVEKQLITLEAQAAQAFLYKKQKAEFEKLEKALFVIKWENFHLRSLAIVEKEIQTKQALAIAQGWLENTQQALQQAKQQLSDRERISLSGNEELFCARNDKAIHVKEKQSQETRLKENSAKEKRWKSELDSLLAKQKQMESEKVALESKLHSIEALLSENGKKLLTQKEKTASLEQNVTELRECYQESQKEKLKNIQIENAIESELKQNRIRQESLLERKKSLIERNQKLERMIQDFSQQIDEKRKALEEVSQSVDQQKSSLDILNRQFKDISTEISRYKHSLEVLQQENTEAKTRYKVLTRLSQDKEGFSKGSKLLLQESENPKSPLYGILKELHVCFNQTENSALELAGILKQYAQTLVVENQKDLNTVLAFAAEQQLKDFSILCVDTIPNTKPSTSHKLHPASLLKKVGSNLITEHFLKDVFSLDTFEDKEMILKLHPRASFWVQGYFQDNFHVLFSPTQTESNVFIREAELRSLEKKIETLGSDQEALISELKSLYKKSGELESQISILDKSIRKEEMRLVEINFGFQRASSDIEKAKGEKTQGDQDGAQCQSALEKVEKALIEGAQKHADIKVKESLFNKQFVQLQSDVDGQMAALKKEKELLHEREVVYRKSSEEQKKWAHELHILEVQNREIQKQEKRLVEELQICEMMQQQFKHKEGEIESHIDEAEKKIQKLVFLHKEVEQKVLKDKEQIERVESHCLNARNEKSKVEEELLKLGLQKEQNDTSLKELAEGIQERYHLTIEEALALVSVNSHHPQSVESIEKQLKMLRHEIDSMGDVNMTAIEECDKNKTRYEFLKEQIGDLDVSKKELVEIISTLDAESRTKFKETFAAISLNFKKNFQILFNGGEADLQFTEAADLLEAGIEIIAKPPGKQMRSINLLSGGEKCLTSMALLFAIFEEKSAPFCILDEIDASLDDSNVDRFVNVLRQFINRCQFIIITHNKRTMSIADKLYGVSMQEKGVSTMLTMEFAQQGSLAEVGLLQQGYAG